MRFMRYQSKICRLVFIALLYVPVYKLQGQRIVAELGQDVQSSSIDWCSTCGYLAVGGGLDNPSIISIYKFDTSAADPLVSVTSWDRTATVKSVSWCDCEYLVVGGVFNGVSEFEVYTFDPATESLSPTATFHRDGEVNTVDWCSDCEHLAVGGELSKFGSEFEVYTFDSGLPASLTLTATFHRDGIVNSLDWCGTCSYLLVGGFNNGISDFEVYKFESPASLTPNVTGSYGNTVYSVAWCLDCDYLAVQGGRTGAALPYYTGAVYQFVDGFDLNEITRIEGPSAPRPGSVDWCGDCKNLAVTDETSLNVYEFNESELKQLEEYPSRPFPNTDPYQAKWCGDCRYLAVLSWNSTLHDKGISPAGVLSIIDSSLATSVPLTVRKYQECHRFPTQADFINILNWDPIVDVVAYRVYTEGQKTLLTTISSINLLQFQQHCICPGQKTVYNLTSVFADGTESEPVVVTVP